MNFLLENDRFLFLLSIFFSFNILQCYQYPKEHSIMKTFICALLISFTPSSRGLVGYDCGKQWQGTEKYSATEVEECPQIEGWYKEPVPVEVQLIRQPHKLKLKTTVCDVKVNKIVHYCGRLDSLQYGIPIQLETGKHHKMSQRECSNLVNKQQMEYKGEIFHVDPEKKEFSRDIVTKGKRDAEAGTCTAAAPFRANNQAFDHHVMREVIQVTIREEELEYKVADKAVIIGKVPVPLEDEYFQSERFTYIWRDPTQECDEGGHMFEAFYGTGVLYEPTNPNLRQMILVNHPASSQTFGIEMRQLTKKCKTEIYSTQLDEVKIAINVTRSLTKRDFWRIPNLPRTRLQDVNPVQNLQALVGYNYVSQAATLSDVIAELSSKACEDRRKIALNNLSILRIKPEEGVFLMYGRGYNAVVRGSVFYLYQCEKRTFQYRETQEDYEDIPVTYQDGKQTLIGFLDSISFNFKTTSIQYTNNGLLPAVYNYNGAWKCKQGALIDCGEVKQLGHNFDGVVETLKQRANDVVYDGGVDDIESRKRFRESVNEASDIEAGLYGVGVAAYENTQVSEDKLFELFHLNGIKTAIQNASWLGNAWDYTVKGGSILLGCLAVYFIGVRCHLFRTAGDAFRSSYWNLFHAIFNGSQFHSNLNLSNHNDLRNQLTEARRLLETRIRILEPEDYPSSPPHEEGEQLERLGNTYPTLPLHETSPYIIRN